MSLKKSKIRQSFGLLLLVILSVLAVGCKKHGSKNVKIGVVIPMTGAGAATVDYWVNGFNMAIEKLNEENKNEKYEIIFEDSKSDPATSISCYKRLEMQGVKYVVAVGGQFAMAIAPMTKGKDILYFTSADYNEAVLDITDCAFRVYPSANALGTTTSDYMADTLGIKKAAAISLNTVPCLQAYNAFAKNLKQMGGTIEFSDEYDIGAYEFKNTISKMAQKDFQGIFITGFGISPAAFCAQMAGNPKFDNMVLMGDVNLSTKSFAENKKNDKVEVYYADATIGDGFRDKYEKQYGGKANSYCGCAYLIPHIIDQARKAVDDPNDIAKQKKYLRGCKIENEVANLSFDEKGNGGMEMSVYKLQ
jgi:branched-chain amino acid transport system substrate-binding protein